MNSDTPRIPFLVLALAAALLACGGEGDPGALSEGNPSPGPTGKVAGRVGEMADAARAAPGPAELVVDYPIEGSIFPPEFIPPTFLWHDSDPRSDVWLVEIEFGGDDAKPLTAVVPGEHPTLGPVDEETIAPGRRLDYRTDYQRSARSWTPSDVAWEFVKKQSVEAPATVTFTGFASGDPSTPLSHGSVRLSTSSDPVGAPIFYRDVPLMPDTGVAGRIKPLGDKFIPLIAWRLRDVSRRSTKLVLKGMPTCGNCHSFSLDGETLGMDVDGPSGDKGMYTLKTLSKNTVIGYDDVLTWNSFPGRPEGHKTIGFLSRISPDGAFVVSTVNESLYVENFADYRFLQVFFPTRGILAYYSRKSGEIRALPGADDPEYVHCDPAWTPDGKQLVFARAKARDPYLPGQPAAKYAGDPNERRIRYDLYRMPFDGGKGGAPVPIEGASDNGMSNSFPKVSPDGRWIVFVRSANGQLMRPDGRLWIVPVEGGEAREMRCNTDRMNSWHSFSPNSRWMVFSSKTSSPYTQAFLTHLDDHGNDSPAILVPDCTAANRAVNLPEFMNAPIESLDTIDVPVVDHHRHLLAAEGLLKQERFVEAAMELRGALEAEPTFARAHLAMGFALGNLGRPRDAADFFGYAAECDPSNPVAWFNLGSAYLRSGEPRKAVLALERLRSVAPEYPRGAATLERARQELELATKRAEELGRSVEEAPRDTELLLRLVDCLLSAGEEARAADRLARAEQLGSNDPTVFTRFAWLLATSRDAGIRDGQRAVELARRAVELSGGTSPAPLDTLAAALAETGRFEEAIVAGERAATLAEEVDPVLATRIDLRLSLYRRGKPYRSGPEY